MSGKQNKRLRKLVSSNTKTGKPTKAQFKKLKNSYKDLSSNVRGNFLGLLEDFNQKIAKKDEKGVDGGEAKT